MLGGGGAVGGGARGTGVGEGRGRGGGGLTPRARVRAWAARPSGEGGLSGGAWGPRVFVAGRGGLGVARGGAGGGGWGGPGFWWGVAGGVGGGGGGRGGVRGGGAVGAGGGGGGVGGGGGGGGGGRGGGGGEDLHEKIMARVTGKVQPLGSRRPLWVFPDWGLATAACLSIFLLIQDPDLLTFNAKKTSPPPEPFEKAASSLNAPKPFSPVPLNKAIAEKKEAPQTSANENLDNKVISKNFAASEEAPPASAPKPMALKHLEKKTRRDTTAFAAADEANSPSALPASNPADQVMANAPQAQGASAEKVDALRENGAMAAPTEGSLENLSYLKQITASKWTGNNAPVTVETQELVTDGLDFKQDWQELRPGEEVPRVDFTTQAVVLLMAGEEPTPGIPFMFQPWRKSRSNSHPLPIGNTYAWNLRGPGPHPSLVHASNSKIPKTGPIPKRTLTKGLRVKSKRS